MLKKLFGKKKQEASADEAVSTDVALAENTPASGEGDQGPSAQGGQLPVVADPSGDGAGGADQAMVVAKPRKRRRKIKPLEMRQGGAIIEMPFKPIEIPPDKIGQMDQPTLFKRRIVLYGSISAVLGLIIYIFMEDPGDILFSLTGQKVTLSWSGLVVYSSIVSLVMFLCMLLFRYFALLNLAYINMAKYTAQDDDDNDFLPMVTVIAPVYNEGVLLEATLDALVQLDYPLYEVLLINDGSKDNTLEIGMKYVGHYPNCELRIVDKPNGGKSTALNAGIQVAQSDFVLNVDGDAVLSPDTLTKAVRHMKDPRVGAVAGNVKVSNRDNMWTTLQALEYVEGLNMARSAQASVKLVNIIPGPLGLFRKQAIIDGNWYATDTFAEDCDLTLKIIREGWRADYEPEAISYTEAPNKLIDLLKQRYRWTRGIIQAVRKHSDLFWNPTINFGGTIVMWMMAFESLIWPIMNIFGNLYFIAIAVFFDLSYYLVYWWLSLTILDMIAAFYCVAVEKEEVRLIFYSVFYRLFFILIIDVCKALATVEEFLGLGMNWGKLDRVGTG